jgi:ribosomal protein L21E
VKVGDRVIIHYAASNGMPNPKWRDRQGIVLAVSRPGRGPRNVMVDTPIGRVVVPRWNVREGSV